ncbi:MAG: OmpA family protein [Flavobacteriales bacterium]|nr:OmpA family protein [Flavobacteriales bacterium]
MRLRPIISLSVLLSTPLLFSQSGAARVNKPFDKEHFADGDGLKEALSAIKQGDKLFQDGGTHFTEALELFEKACAFNPDNADLNLKMGLCHLNGRFHHKALPYFQAAYGLKNDIPRIHFLMAMGYHLNAEWDKAIAEYSVHKTAVSRVPDPEPLYNSADRRIAECQHGKGLQAKPVNGQVSNMGPAINSEVADYGVLITADGERMMFTSRRSNSTGGKINKATNEYFEDIYGCTRSEHGWTEPLPLPVPVNSTINDASVGLFNDGRTMIIYRDDSGTGDLYESKREGETWSEPVSMGENINSPANETSAWFSFDRKQLYFVSDREGGLGGQDIWMSRWDGVANVWGEAENLGPRINTFEDEDGVFIHPDGTTLYFSSKGHSCMGGYDVFKSSFADGKWSSATNLGWPVNSPDDDLFFVLTANGTTGYFSSVRPNGLGEDDIYRVDFLPEAKAEETASMFGGGTISRNAGMKTVLLKGKIMDYKELAALEATIELMDLSDARLVATFTSDPTTGEYLVAVPGGRQYAMIVRAGGYLLHSENIAIPLESSALEMNMEIKLQPIEVDHKEVMRNIFFERDKAILNPSSLAELGQLLDLLRENPSLRLEIGGYTDSDGNDDHNDQLSTERAYAVVSHLVNNGIPSDRLVAVGYGSANPLVPNDSDENKAKNRRTEMRVL